MSTPDPRANNRRETGTTRRANAVQMIDLFAFPALTNLGRVLDEDAAYRDQRGRRSYYSDRVLLAVTACARITGSTASALSALREPGVWQACRAADFAITGRPMADTPPTRDHVDHFRAKITRADKDTGVPELLRRLSVAFTSAAVKQARLHGNLLPGVQPDFTQFDSRHMVFGDGTILKPFSDVVVVANPVTGELMAVGSRAASFGAARIQRDTRRSGTDEKAQSGINFVSLATRTGHGRVVLAVGAETGAEIWATLDLCDRVAAAAGNAVHTLVYDRAVTGWTVGYLMARHRIQVLGKVSAGDGKNPARRAAANAFSERIAALAVRLGVKVDNINEPILRTDVLGRMHRGERLQRVGTSVYPTTKGYDVAYGYFAFVTATHQGASGARCEHDLVMDDGALFTVGIDELGEELVKTAHLPCQAATAVFDAVAGTWGTTSTYLVPCEKGDFTYTRTWAPSDTRYTKGDGHKAPEAQDPIGWRLHPISRTDPKRFKDVEQGRNDSESYNAQFKRSLPGKSRTRGSAITLAGQELDFLLGGLVANSETWANGRL